jgi:hypothetical protein
MKLTLLKSSYHPSVPPHPTIYKCKIIRASGGRSQVVHFVGPLYLLPVGGHAATRKPN